MWIERVRTQEQSVRFRFRGERVRRIVRRESSKDSSKDSSKREFGREKSKIRQREFEEKKKEFERGIVRFRF